MKLHENLCLVCERLLLPTQKQDSSHDCYSYECPRCGRYGVTHLGSLCLEHKGHYSGWSVADRALISGWIRARQIKGDDPPVFGYTPNRSADGTGHLIYVEDVIREVPKSIDDQVNATMLNLGRLSAKDRGQWMKLSREADLSLFYAANIDEAAMVLHGLKEDGYANYELPMSAILVQLTVSGWRHFERLNRPVDTVMAAQANVRNESQANDVLPSRIWTVQEYHQAKEFYEKRNLVFNPALELGSPAEYHVRAQIQLRASAAAKTDPAILSRREGSMVSAKSSSTGSVSEIIKVLLLSANPIDSPLSIDEEFRAIDQKIRSSEHRDHVNLIKHGAVRLEDVPGLLMRYKPDVVHFSGHGATSGIALTGADGKGRLVPPDALANIFRTLKDNVRVVLLNACDSAAQAEAIVSEIDCAVGMSDQISDDAAIAFAAAFYEALGYGKWVQSAFDLALVQLEGAGADRSLAKLYKRGTIVPSDVILVKPLHPR